MKIFNLVIIALTLVLSAAANAQTPSRIAQLKSGSYKLEVGSDESCETSFSIKYSGNEENVLLGASFGIGTVANVIPRIAKSDIDPKCNFVEINRREDSSASTVVTRTNNEVCGREIKSETITRATFTDGVIKVDIENKGETPSKCIWKLVK